MKISKLIKETRVHLMESQGEFGRRFGNSATAVSMWESGQRRSKHEVIEFCLNRQMDISICPKCRGKGILIYLADMTSPRKEDK